MSSYRLCAKVFFGVIAFCFGAYPFSGRVIDERSNPVEGVTVTAVNSNQQTLTTQDGRFSLATPVIQFIGNGGGKAPIRMLGRHLIVSIAGAPQLVSVSQIDINGRLISMIYNKRLNAGVHAIALETIQNKTRVSIVHIRIGSAQYVREVVSLGESTFSNASSMRSTTQSGFSKSALGLSNTLTDTLLLSKDGYLNKRIVVKEQDEIVGDLRLYDSVFTLSASNFPKLDGSTTNVPLARIMCCTFMNTSYTWQERTSFPATVYWEVVPDSTDKPLFEQIMAITSFSKTPQSYDSLIAGKRDLILVASAPSLRHYEAATAAGLDFDIRPFATDALLMVVNKNSAITAITTQNIRDIYTKTVTNWNQVGGPDLTIAPYQREETSGSQELIKTLVMKGTPIDESVPLLWGMMSVFEALHFGTSAISYTPFYYKEYQMRDSLIRALSIDAITPDRSTLYSQTYPHCAHVLVVSLTNLSDTTKAAKLRDWLLAPQGQRVVSESGYVPIRDPDGIAN